MNIIEAINDPKLLGRFFKDKMTWLNWLVILKGIFGLPMAKWEQERWTKLTGRTYEPRRQFFEIFLLIGRRGGKSFMVSIIAVFLAVFCGWTPFLVAGEQGIILIVAVDMIQARIILNYIRGIINAVPMFKAKVVRERAWDIELEGRVTIQIRTAAVASVRGYTLVGCVLEEASFWRVDGVNPGNEILRAIRPGLATIPESRLIAISSAYSRSGIMYEAHRDHFGKDDSDTLVVGAPTRTMNPTISQAYIDKELAKDPVGAASEWLNDFRSDISGFLLWEWIEKAVVKDRFELAPQSGIAYQAFCDPSGGSGDSFAASIGHTEVNRLIQDKLVRIPSPSNPHHSTERIAEVLKEYGIDTVKGDKYSARWVVDAFASHGITYVQSKRSKSDLYLEAAPLFARGQVDILDNKVQSGELRGLERRTGRSGKDSVDHAPRQHDDCANSLCGMLVNLVEPKAGFNFEFIDLDNPPMRDPSVDPRTNFVDGRRRPMLKATAPAPQSECRMNNCTSEVVGGGEYCFPCQEEVNRRLGR